MLTLVSVFFYNSSEIRRILPKGGPHLEPLAEEPGIHKSSGMEVSIVSPKYIFFFSQKLHFWSINLKIKCMLTMIIRLWSVWHLHFFPNSSLKTNTVILANFTRSMVLMRAVNWSGGGSALGVEWPDGNRKLTNSNPGSARVGVDVSLSKTLATHNCGAHLGTHTGPQPGINFVPQWQWGLNFKPQWQWGWEWEWGSPWG